jgi:hypothetical protein
LIFRGVWLVAPIHSGWHGIWEVAIMCMERGLGGVFGEAEVKLLLKTQTATFQGLGADRVGKFTAGASAAAALWWLLCQPKAAIRQPPTVSDADHDTSSCCCAFTHQACPPLKHRDYPVDIADVMNTS